MFLPRGECRYGLPAVRIPLLALLLSAPAFADAQGTARLWVGSGYDSNARRDFVRDDGSGAVAPEPDLVLSAIGAAEGRVRGPSVQATGAYELGLREFMRLPTEDVTIQSANLDGSVAVSRQLAVGLDARGKDRRGGERDYTDLSAEAFAEWAPDAAVDLRARGGAHRFIYWDPIGYSFGASELGLSARYRFDRHHSALLFGDLGSRIYQSMTHPNPVVAAPPPPDRRRDQVLGAGAGYSYRGPFTVTLTYSYTEQDSNSFGETVTRHRLAATGGFRLPWRLALFAQAAVQLSRYPDGVYLSDELNITEDDDTHNAVSLRLVRPVSEHIDADLRYSLYEDRLPQNGISYLRQAAWVGLTWRL